MKYSFENKKFFDSFEEAYRFYCHNPNDNNDKVCPNFKKNEHGKYCDYIVQFSWWFYSHGALNIHLKMGDTYEDFCQDLFKIFHKMYKKAPSEHKKICKAIERSINKHAKIMNLIGWSDMGNTLRPSYPWDIESVQ